MAEHAQERFHLLRALHHHVGPPDAYPRRHQREPDIGRFYRDYGFHRHRPGAVFVEACGAVGWSFLLSLVEVVVEPVVC